MGGINRLAVQHSWSLFKRAEARYPEKAYGDNFTYSEITAKPKYYQAVLYVFAISAFIAGILFPPVSLPSCWSLYIPSNTFEDTVDSQAYLTKTWHWACSVYMFPPSLLNGPADHAAYFREGYFMATNISHCGPSKIKTVIQANGEPGYFGTARIISEAALALVLDFNKLPYKQVGGAGVLTPMTALGDVLIGRMKKYYGLQIESEVVSGDEGRKRR